MRCQILLVSLISVAFFASASQCFGADDKVLQLKLRHVFLGEMKRYVNQKGIACDFTDLGFEDLYKVENPEKVVIFNRESKLYYEGNSNNNSNLNRVSILVGMGSRANAKNFTWGNEKWSKEKFDQLGEVKCSYFETQKDNEKWQIWISKEYKLPRQAYSIVSEWVRLPNLNGLPVRAVRTNRFGKKTVVLECLTAKRMPAPADFLKFPSGLKRVSNVAEVCAAKDSFLNDVLETLK